MINRQSPIAMRAEALSLSCQPSMSMSRLSIAIVLIVFLGLVGCIAPSADSRLVGTYLGKDSESLTILSDTRVYHTRAVDGREQRIVIGYAAAASDSPPGSLSIIGPDTSPFIGTSLQVSDDFRTITVHWGNYANQRYTPAQTEFIRREDG
jgi:hypothetical protein